MGSKLQDLVIVGEFDPNIYAGMVIGAELHNTLRSSIETVELPPSFTLRRRARSRSRA